MGIAISELLERTVAMDASDLHLGVGEPPVLRIHGSLHRLSGYSPLQPEDTEAIARSIASDRTLREFEQLHGADFGISYEDKARFRVSLYRQKGTVSLSLRLIPYRILTFEQLGLSQEVVHLLHAPRGLILMTGPTGSGKTTTLATMLDYINRERDCHIITIEDPIEYYHTSKKSMISQREVGVDVPSFDVGVIKSLRQDPDVILVGEMRDLLTIQAAVTAAETGHLVFSTLHTTGSARTVDRITDVFPHDQQEQIRVQLSMNLLAVISQLLVPRPDGKGRVAVFEIMVCTPAIQHLIRDMKTHNILSAIQTGHQLGMITLDDSLVWRVRRGEISHDEALRLAQNPTELEEKLVHGVVRGQSHASSNGVGAHH